MNKKLLFFLFIFSCFAIFNVGCSKDDDDNTATTTLNNQLTAKVNGTAWSSNTTGYSVSMSTTAKIVTIQTEGANDTQIYLLAKENTDGTHSLLAASYTEGASACTATTPISGSISITRKTTGKDVAGTFNFSASCSSSTVNITEGKFDFKN